MDREALGKHSKSHTASPLLKANRLHYIRHKRREICYKKMAIAYSLLPTLPPTRRPFVRPLVRSPALRRPAGLSARPSGPSGWSDSHIHIYNKLQ